MDCLCSGVDLLRSSMETLRSSTTSLHSLIGYLWTDTESDSALSAPRRVLNMDAKEWLILIVLFTISTAIILCFPGGMKRAAPKPVNHSAIVHDPEFPDLEYLLRSIQADEQAKWRSVDDSSSGSAGSTPPKARVRSGPARRGVLRADHNDAGRGRVSSMQAEMGHAAIYGGGAAVGRGGEAQGWKLADRANNQWR